MARRRFGGAVADWAFTVGSGNVPVLLPGATLTFWTAITGGTQYTDLAANSDGTGPMTTATAQSTGQVPVLYGPDTLTAMWMSANGGPRVLLLANDTASTTPVLGGDNTWTGLQTVGPIGDAAKSRLVLYAEATGQVADLFTAWSGTDTGQGGARQRTTYLNEKGELRVIAAKTNSVGVRVKGQTGQTANVFEHTDISNNAVAWMGPDGAWRAPNLGDLITLRVAGTLAAGGSSPDRYYNDTGVTLTLRAVRVNVRVAPTGQAARFDLNKNGVTVFTTQANRPTIAIGAVTSGKVSNLDIVTLADGDYLTLDVDQVGSTVAGSDALAQVLVY